MESQKKCVYLDNAATTRCAPEIARRVFEVLTDEYGNPSSLHTLGFRAERLMEEAKRQCAGLLGAKPEELLFTSGATESNNLAIKGGALARKRRGRRVLVPGTEHASVLGAAKWLSENGFEVADAPVGNDGMLSAQSVEALVDKDTVLLCCMMVNNETGAVCDVSAVAEAARRKNPGILIHCDGVQAVGKLPVRPGRLGVDTLSFSGHKIHGPKGIGGLWIKKGVRLIPQLHGGGQQNALRPGTENTAYIAGLGLACALCAGSMTQQLEKTAGLNALLRREAEKIPGICINSPETATPYIVSLSVPGIRSETMLHFLESRGVYVSSGSACTKGARSHVLTAMGLPAGRVDSALRLSFGRESAEEDVLFALHCLRAGMTALARAKGPKGLGL